MKEKKERITVTLDKKTVNFLNDIIKDGIYRNRSHVVELAIQLLKEKRKEEK